MTVLGALNIIIFTIAAIANLLAISGGGLVLPPFKSLYWLQTETTFVGLYGGCPKSASDGFFALDSNWRDLQSSCWQFFKLGESTIDGTCIFFALMISG
jgi:hypothetical protein